MNFWSLERKSSKEKNCKVKFVPWFWKMANRNYALLFQVVCGRVSSFIGEGISTINQMETDSPLSSTSFECCIRTMWQQRNSGVEFIQLHLQIQFCLKFNEEDEYDENWLMFIIFKALFSVYICGALTFMTHSYSYGLGSCIGSLILFAKRLIMLVLHLLLVL